MRQGAHKESKQGISVPFSFDDAIRVAKVAMLGAVVFALGWGGVLLYRTYDVPIAVIGVEGALKKVGAAELEAIVATNLGGGFLSLDLDGICDALKEHPWIVRASARRKWPNEVVITVEEETPIARWGKEKFLSNQGRVLDVADVQLPEKLPLLDGPEGQERAVMQQYRNFSQTLRPLGLKIEICQLAPRNNWVLTFDNGLELVGGKQPVAEKLDRFLKVWGDLLQSRVDEVAHVDIRYANGIAVRWKEDLSSGESPDGKS